MIILFESPLPLVANEGQYNESRDTVWNFLIRVFFLPLAMHSIKKLQALFHPERYHGWGRTKKYFEGWYYKIVSADEKHAFAIIPGIAMDEAGNQHAFIQLLDGKAQSAEYIRFPADAFRAESGRFSVHLADNVFTLHKMYLNLETAKGELSINQVVPWPNSITSPGIMGPFAFVPFMECYHGVVSMNHSLGGALVIGGKHIDFSGGRGYIEKDWGHSFPSAYIWMQSNHFAAPGISFKASVAKIPWLGSSFTGFIAGLYFNRQLIQFTTYNGTRLIRSLVDHEKVELAMENRKHRLEVLVKRNAATELASPISGFMDGRISESMTSEIGLILKDKKSGKTLFHDIGKNAALEVAGKIDEIIVMEQ